MALIIGGDTMLGIVTVEFYSHKGTFMDGWDIEISDMAQYIGNDVYDMDDENLCALAQRFCEVRHAHNLYLLHGAYVRAIPEGRRGYRWVF